MKKQIIISAVFSLVLIIYLMVDTKTISFALGLGLFLLLWFCLIHGFGKKIIKIPAKMNYMILLLPFFVYLLTLIYQKSLFGIHGIYFTAYIVIPSILVICLRKKRLSNISAIFTALLLWIPFDHRYYRLFWPKSFSHGYNFMSLMVVMMAIILFIYIRKDITTRGFLTVKKGDFRLIAVITAIISLIIIPVGVITGFLEFKDKISFDPYYILAFVGIFITIGLVEEIIFRAVIQNLLEKVYKSHIPALLTASVLFGITHWNNAEPGFAIVYIILASIAGVFYGTAYKRSGSLFPPVFIHALIDTIWLVLFIK